MLVAAALVAQSRRAREVLRELLVFGKRPTKHLLKAALGRVSRDDYDLLVQLAALGLVKRYPGHDENNHYVVWNEITPLGKKVLEVLGELPGEEGAGAEGRAEDSDV